MPPKRLAHAQNLRDAFTEAQSCEVVEQWATDVIPHVGQIMQEAAAQRAKMQQMNVAYTCANAMQPPAEVALLLQTYQSLCHRVFSDAELLRTVIAVRIPELKEEDNLGVAVQNAVLTKIDELEGKLIDDGGDKGGNLKGLAGMYSLRDYYMTRGNIEDKLIGKPGESNENKGGSKSPSLLLELRQVDMDALLKLELGAIRLSTLLRAFVNSYAVNWKKLIQPRNPGDHMVS